jgi:2-polyprenyl-3-methyl-5-hydroxy-6-metoxy-1,4-benzoquinol methylase
MALSSNKPPYVILSRFYDPLTVFYRPLCDKARAKILGRVLPGVRVACDLGAGTGTTAIKLARTGRKVFAVDASGGSVGSSLAGRVKFTS